MWGKICKLSEKKHSRTLLCGLSCYLMYHVVSDYEIITCVFIFFLFLTNSECFFDSKVGTNFLYVVCQNGSRGLLRMKTMVPPTVHQKSMQQNDCFIWTFSFFLLKTVGLGEFCRQQRWKKSSRENIKRAGPTGRDAGIHWCPVDCYAAWYCWHVN